MQILKKTYTKNNSEITLICRCEEKQSFDAAIQKKSKNELDCFTSLCGQGLSPHPSVVPFVNAHQKTSSKTILIIGVFHGEEPQGKFLIEEYIKKNSTSPLTSILPPMGRGSNNNSLLFIPCLNPDGMTINTRQNSNGVDLNRNFPTKNWELTERNDYFGGEYPASEIETKFVIEIIEEYKPDIILTLHAPYKIVNFDGPAQKIAEGISQIIGYPTESDIGYPTPGSFGTYAGVERNIPTITLELDEETDLANLTKPVFEIFNYLMLI